MVSSALLLLVVALAPAPDAAVAAPSPGVAAELRAGVGAPLGPVGLALSVPFGRLSVGGGLGVGNVRLHEALFGRVALIRGPRLRLSLELGWSEGSTTEATATPAGSRLSSTRGGNRYDAAAIGEVGVGQAWVGLQAGVGYLDGSATCLQQDVMTGVFMPCDPGSAPAPPSWVPFLALSLRHRDQAAAEGTTTVQLAAASGRQLRLFVAGTRIERTDVFSDGHFDGATGGTGSLQGEVLWGKGAYFRYGVGLRYEVAHVTDTYPGRAGYDHFVYVPFLVGAALPLAGANQLELLAGVGLGAGLVRGGETSDHSDYMRAAGPAFELDLTYWTRVASGLDASLGLAVTASALGIQNGTDYFRTGSVLRGTLPLRIGLRWSL